MVNSVALKWNGQQRQRNSAKNSISTIMNTLTLGCPCDILWGESVKWGVSYIEIQLKEKPMEVVKDTVTEYTGIGF